MEAPEVAEEDAPAGADMEEPAAAIGSTATTLPFWIPAALADAWVDEEGDAQPARKAAPSRQASKDLMG
jgi:hypothetical protein